MKIFNIMLAKGLGGIEQVFLDYTKALSDIGHSITSIHHPGSALKEKITGERRSLYNLNKYDLLAIYRLKRYCLKDKPDCIITHGNRATTLFRKTNLKIPHIAVCHNYQVKPLIGSDALVTITEDIKSHVVSLGQPAEDTYVVPNMMHLPHNFGTKKTSSLHTPPTIGFLGRFVPKKGVQVFIQALLHLREQNIAFKALIGGDGPQKENLLAQVKEAGLENEIEFLGWVEDKQDFFDKLDIFCLPSFQEPFGLVLLEAMSYGTPVVSTNASGPAAIATQDRDVLFTNIGTPQEMSKNLKRLIEDKHLREKLIRGGYETVKNYTPDIIGKSLDDVIKNITYRCDEACKSHA